MMVTAWEGLSLSWCIILEETSKKRAFKFGGFENISTFATRSKNEALLILKVEKNAENKHQKNEV
jgi:hypothetical protein